MQKYNSVEILEPRIAPAAVFTWDGGGRSDKHWTNPANWVGDIAPEPGSALVFPDEALRDYSVTATNDYPAGTLFDSITFLPSDVPVYEHRYFLDGNSVGLANGVHMSLSSTLGMDLMLTSNQTFTGGFFYGGTIDLQGNTLTLAPPGYSDFYNGRIVDSKTGTSRVINQQESLGIGGTANPILVQSNGGNVFVGDNPRTDIAITDATVSFFAVGSLTTVASHIAMYQVPGVPGHKSVRGELTMDAKSSIAMIIQPSDLQYSSLLSVGGRVSLNQPTLSVALTSQPQNARELILIENAGTDAVLGQFAGLPEGAVVHPIPAELGLPTPILATLRITYAGGDGNDVALIPETAEAHVSGDGKAATYIDVDGDKVTIRSMKGGLKAENIVLSPANSIGGHQLLWLDAPAAKNASLSITAERTARGNGHVNVGEIRSAHLKALSVDGDLASLEAWGWNIGQLSVRSLGLKASKTLPEESFGAYIGVRHLQEARVGSDVAGHVNVGRVETFVAGGSLTGTLFVGSADSIRIHGDVRGTSEPHSGSITLGFADRQDPVIRSIRIDGSLIGGSGKHSGVIRADVGTLEHVEIEGSVRASSHGATGLGASILASEQIRKIEIHGSILGNETHPVTIGADGFLLKHDAALGTVYVDGDVRYARFVAGRAFAHQSEHRYVYFNADASIKGIVVKGDWIASTATAGVMAGVDHLIGTADDQLLAHDRLYDYYTNGEIDGNPNVVAHIGAIIVYGRARGTSRPDDSFGIVAEQIGFVHVGTGTLRLKEGPGDNDDFIYVDTEHRGPNGARSDFTIHEVPSQPRHRF